jgi:ParB-like chromosome segregation protein Spo0J
MQIERKAIRDMDRAAYNPRIELIPGDMEYENLRRSIKTYGMIIPVVWNRRLFPEPKPSCRYQQKDK